MDAATRLCFQPLGRFDFVESVSFHTPFRLSREGGNPSPKLEYISRACVVWLVRVMNSRLRGNDKVFLNIVCHLKVSTT